MASAASVVDDLLDLLKKSKPQNVLKNFDDNFAYATTSLTKEAYAELTVSGDEILNEVRTRYHKDLKGTSFWDKKRNQQLVYDGADNVHGGHNFYTREGTMFNVPDSDIGGLSQYKGKNKLDHATLEGYNRAMMDLEYMDDKLKYKDPDKYFTNVKNKINEIDAYEKKIGKNYKNFRGNKDYQKRRSWMADDVNEHFGEEVLSKDPFKQNTTRSVSNNTTSNTTKNVSTNTTTKNTTTTTTTTNTTKNVTKEVTKNTDNTTRRRNDRERTRQDRTRNNSQQNIEKRNNRRRIEKNKNKNVNKPNPKTVLDNPTVPNVDKMFDDIVNKPIDGMSTGGKRYIKNQQTKSWKKEMVKPKDVSWSYYNDMKSTIKGIHEYAKTVPKPIFPLRNDASPEEIQKAIQQYNVWNSAQNDSRSLKFLGRDLKQNQERFERAQANIDETIKNQKKNEAIEKEYQEWKSQQRIKNDHAEAIEMNKMYDMHTEAIEMNKQFDIEKGESIIQSYRDNFNQNNLYQFNAAEAEGKHFDAFNTYTYDEAHEAALEINNKIDETNKTRIKDIDEAWDEAIDEDFARETVRQRKLEEELPDIFKNGSNNTSINPNTRTVMNNTSGSSTPLQTPGNNSGVFVGNVYNSNTGQTASGPSGSGPKKRRTSGRKNRGPSNPGSSGGAGTGLSVVNQGGAVGRSTLNPGDPNVIEGTFRVLDDADDVSGAKLPGKASLFGTAMAAIGAISDYKDARRKGHGVISSGLRAAGSFVLGEVLGWKGQLALMAVKAIPSATIKGTQMLYQENRRMNSAANQQVFGGSQFHDTQQLATMRQSGMEMAKMAQYNLQQTLMGNEATYLHR